MQYFPFYGTDDLDFGGDQVNILSRNYGSDPVDEIFVEGLNSDPVNDAIFERNTEVEQRLNIRINSIREATAEPITKIISAINAGSKDYDIMVELSWKVMPKSIDGYFTDLRSDREGPGAVLRHRRRYVRGARSQRLPGVFPHHLLQQLCAVGSQNLIMGTNF